MVFWAFWGTNTPILGNHPIFDVRNGTPQSFPSSFRIPSPKAQAEIEALRADKSLWGLDEDFLELLVESLGNGDGEMELNVFDMDSTFRNFAYDTHQ